MITEDTQPKNYKQGKLYMLNHKIYRLFSKKKDGSLYLKVWRAVEAFKKAGDVIPAYMLLEAQRRDENFKAHTLSPVQFAPTHGQIKLSKALSSNLSHSELLSEISDYLESYAPSCLPDRNET